MVVSHLAVYPSRLLRKDIPLNKLFRDAKVRSTTKLRVEITGEGVDCSEMFAYNRFWGVDVRLRGKGYNLSKAFKSSGYLSGSVRLEMDGDNDLTEAFSGISFLEDFEFNRASSIESANVSGMFCNASFEKGFRLPSGMAEGNYRSFCYMPEMLPFHNAKYMGVPLHLMCGLVGYDSLCSVDEFTYAQVLSENGWNFEECGKLPESYMSIFKWLAGSDKVRAKITAKNLASSGKSLSEVRAFMLWLCIFTDEDINEALEYVRVDRELSKDTSKESQIRRVLNEINTDCSAVEMMRAVGVARADLILREYSEGIVDREIVKYICDTGAKKRKTDK